MPPEINPWTAVPFHFWTFVYFVFGTMVGSFLNVCIHRMPLDLSIVKPRSHCPHCKYSIPWYLNIPLITWLYLRGRCANCKAPISIRYFMVELLTGVLFAGAWISYGEITPYLPITICILIAGLIAATFIDIEHFIIPDEITIGGMFVGFLCSWLVPLTQHFRTPVLAMKMSFWGIAVGMGLIYGMLRLGKFMFGRQKFEVAPNSKIIFTETELVLPDQAILYGDVLYRRSDAIVFHAQKIETVDRCYADVEVRLSQTRLKIGDDTFKPEDVHYMEAITSGVTIPREAMGLGDVKFMGAIGAFLGWPAVIFCLGVSAFIGSIVGVTLIVARRKDWSSRIPYGPYIAAAALVWIFGGYKVAIFPILEFVRQIVFMFHHTGPAP